MDCDYRTPNEDIHDPVVVARWLRYCDDPIDRCHRCPYGRLEPTDGRMSCMAALHQEAADLIERQN